MARRFKRSTRRLWTLVLVMVGLGTATGLALVAFEDNLLFFYAPSDIVAGNGPREGAFRIGGLVAAGSVDHNGTTVHFLVTDGAESVAVAYTGLLPDLFREGEGVVAHGRMGLDGTFLADQILAKHDETYMPPEVAAALEAVEAARRTSETSLDTSTAGGGY